MTDEYQRGRSDRERELADMHPADRKRIFDAYAVARDDGKHQPAFLRDPRLGCIIACACGEQPDKRPSRMSMMHVWHMSHRRKLGLPRVEYVGDWS